VVLLIVLAVAALAAAAVAVCTVRRLRRLYRLLDREKAAARLTEGCLHRDLEGFRVRVEGLLAQRAVLAEADRVVDAALAAQAGSSGSGDPSSEGGPG
jgi:uncharacterized protein YoxC